MNKWLVTASIVLALAVNGVQAAGNADEGKKQSAVCGGCHGPDGNSGINPLWPKLAGQHPSYIEKQLKDFQAGKRKNDLMSPMAAPLTAQGIADLAAYFSSQTRTIGAASAKLVKAGEKLYRGGNPNTGVAACMACHGPTGAGNPLAVFPSLAGQNAAYVEKALKDFRSGSRTNDNAQMMQGVVQRLTDDEIAAVAQYIQGLHD
jgi:cytochrome c553